MIPVSTVPAVKAYLYDQLTENLTGDSLGVFYGPPGQNQPNYIVSVGDVTDRTVDPFTIVGDGQAGAFREMYHVAVIVSCFHGSELPAVLEATALGYVAQIETLVRADMTLGGTVLKGQPSGSTTSLTWTENYSGLAAVVTLQIACLAEL